MSGAESVAVAAASYDWTLHHKLDTGLNADSVEWCMLDGYEHLLACGLYQLKEIPDEPSRRLGALLLYDVRANDSNCSSVSCNEVHRIENIEGVLDLKWFPHLIEGNPSLVVARADGTCCVYSFQFQQPDIVSSKIVACASVAEQGLSLSVDISSNSTADSPIVLTTTSDGNVVWLHGRKSDDASTASLVLTETARWKAHGFEAWYAIFDIQDPTKVYSGGDDGFFKAWSMLEESVQPVKTVRYDVGLCAMQFRPGHPEQLALGGYGEVVWLFDTASSLKKPLSQIDVGGGVWRIKWNQSDPSYLATATMYNGFHLLGLSENLEFSILLHFDNHTENSLGYGIGWQKGLLRDTDKGSDHAEKSRARGGKSLLATCSFYDHCLQIWSTPVAG